MSKETFIERVKKQFSFLESEYSFKIIFSSNSDVRPQTDGIVKYASDTTMVLIDSETGQAAIRFVRLHDNENYYIDPVSIHEYLNTSIVEKKLLLSKNPKDQPAAMNLFNQKFLLNQPGWKSRGEDVLEDLEKRLKNYANWLKEHANLCLKGDFSRWPEFYEYKTHRLSADELRMGGKETILTVISDDNGSLKAIELPVFHQEMEHLEKLKKEIQG